MGEGIYVIYDHPAINIRLGCHLANEEADLPTNGLDASVLFGTQEKTFIGGLVSPTIGMRSPLLGGILLKKSTCESGLSRSCGARQKEMRLGVKMGEELFPHGVLTNEMSHP
jgi:hypothetical protein